jgi:integrase
MPRVAKELSALEVKRLSEPGMYAVGGVPGLHLQVLPGGGRTWLLRVTTGRKAHPTNPDAAAQVRREIGLGGYPAVTLQQARIKAREVREKIAQGIDPVVERKAARSALMASRAADMTFETAALAFIDAKADEWRNPKHRQQWTNTLTTYALPKIGALSVRDIDTAHILSVLEPVWKTKTETASRLRGRIESVLDWATAHKYRDGANPARWRGHLSMMLPKPTKVSRKGNHAALPASRMGEFMSHLRTMEGMGAWALQFTILTAARSGEVRGATWAEIDLENGVWTVPGDRMKVGKEHRVPLPPEAVKLLEALRRFADNNLVFPAPRGGMLSDMTLAAVIKRMHEVETKAGHKGYTDPKQADRITTPHGFRSTFRDWAAEQTNHPREVAEMALAHTIENKVEAHYRRGDLFAKRRALMEDWAAFCAQTGT